MSAIPRIEPKELPLRPEIEFLYGVGSPPNGPVMINGQVSFGPSYG